MNCLAVVVAIAGSAAAFVPNAATQSPSQLSTTMPDRKWVTMVDPSQRSEALPFLPRPINLDSSMVGDVFCLSRKTFQDLSSLLNGSQQREFLPFIGCVRLSFNTVVCVCLSGSAGSPLMVDWLSPSFPWRNLLCS